MPRSSSSIPTAWSEVLLGYELSARARGLSIRTIANRQSTITGLAIWLEAHHGVTSPDQVTKQHMQLAMQQAYITRSKSGPRGFFNDCKAVWSWYSAEFGTTSPLDGIERPKDVVTPVKILTSAEIEALLKACSGRDFHSVRDAAIICVLLETGMRRAELTALDIEDLDLRKREATIVSGKGGRMRFVCFGPESAQALHRLFRFHPTGEGALFTKSNGLRITEQSVGLILRRRGFQAGVANLRAHIFRHTFCHLWLADGGAEHDLMQLAGWSSGAMISRYGAGLARERALAAAKQRPILSLVRETVAPGPQRLASVTYPDANKRASSSGNRRL